MARVFISYRREDSAAYAGRIQDRLERELGRELLFIDVDGIPLGVNFVKVLREEVAQCGVLLAVIGPHWLDVRDEDGTRRLDNTTDFVRIEIAAALQREIPVIPILLDGTRVPKADQLPEDLKELALRNGLNVRHASFHADLDKLILELKRQVGASRQAGSTPIGANTPFRAENDPSAREPLGGDLLSPVSAKNQVNAAEGEFTRAPAFPNRVTAGTGKQALATESLRLLLWDAQALVELGRREEAIAIYDDLLARFGTATEQALREGVAMALCNKGVALGALGRSEEAIAVYDDLLARFGTATEPMLRGQVAVALRNKGVALGALGRSEEAIAVYDDLLARFGAATERAWLPACEIECRTYADLLP
jgi:tetratricopeptide (TPR) repeat protein